MGGREISMLSKLCQTVNVKHCTISLICGIKKKEKQRNIYSRKGTDSQREKKVVVTS